MVVIILVQVFFSVSSHNIPFIKVKISSYIIWEPLSSLMLGAWSLGLAAWRFFLFLFFNFNFRLNRARIAAGPVFQIIGIFVSLPRYRGSRFLGGLYGLSSLAIYTTRTSPLNSPAVLDFLKEILHPYKIQRIHLFDLNISEDRHLKAEACHSLSAGTYPWTLVSCYNHMTRQRHQVLICAI